MVMSNGAKVGIVAAVGVGAFLLAGGSASAAGAKPVEPCSKTPPDCASLTACAAKILPVASKADVPVLESMNTTAKLLGCTELVKQLDAKIKELSKTGGGGSTIPSDTFTPGGVKDKQRLVNTAWTLARMGVFGALADDFAKYHLQSDLLFGSVGDALAFQATGRPIVNVDTGFVIKRAPSVVLRDMQDAAGIKVDGLWGTQSKAAWSWGLGNGSPTSIGSEATPLRHNHPIRAGVGSESVAGCSACDAKHSVGQAVEIHNPESRGPYNTVPNYDEGYVKFDRAFGSQFGAGPANGPLSKSRVFGRNSFWGGGNGV